MNSSRKKTIKITLLAASSLTILAGATIAPSLPQIEDHFSGNPNAGLLVKLILTIPGLVIAVFAPVAGWFIDHYGRKKILITSLAFYGLAGVSGFFINDIYLLLLSRAFLGLAVAGVMTTATTLVGDYYTGEERKEFLGYQGSFMAIGGVFFILLGGIIADFSWRAPFLLYAVSYIILPFALLVLYEPQLPEKSGNRIQKHPDYPKFWIVFSYFLSLIVMMIFYMVPVFIPFLLKQMSTVSNFQVGLSIATSTLFGAGSSYLYRSVRIKLNFFQVFGLVTLLMGAGFIIISVSGSYEFILLGLVFNGLGFGLMMPNTNFFLLTLSPPGMRGRILGGTASFTFTGQFLSPIVMYPLYNQTGNYQGIFGIVSYVLIFLALLFFLFGNRLNNACKQWFIN